MIYKNCYVLPTNLPFFTAQESSGKQGVLGPTKIYLAVQPPTPGNPQTQSQPPPLAPVQQSPQQVSIF